jgi:hypothetical protein
MWWFDMPKCHNCGFEWGKKKESGRSNHQNRYFHGIILPILSEYTGYDDQEMKAIVKWKFGVKSTSSLNTAEMEAFHEKIRRWAGSKKEDGGLECYIPMPNEVPVLV